jgi:hypothetical protein
MIHDDKDIRQYWSLNPREFHILDRLIMSQTYPAKRPTEILGLELVLRSKEAADRRRLVLSFSGVEELQVTPHASLIQFLMLEIRSIRDRQWENLKYEVKETEEDTLSFYCASFEANIEER